MKFSTRLLISVKKSWHTLLGPGSFLLFCIALFGSEIAHQSDVADRQRSDLGLITQCELRGKGHKNFCHYTFSIGDDQFSGVSRASSGLQFNQTVIVYYDGENPSDSSLEDFSKQSHENGWFLFVLASAMTAISAFVIWDNMPYPEDTNNVSG